MLGSSKIRKYLKELLLQSKQMLVPSDWRQWLS